MGDALLQKTFVTDIFTHRSKKNTGQLPQYYVHDCHPAIIDRETFQRVREEMARRASLPRKSIHGKTPLSKYSGKYALSERLVCGNCGAFYRRVTWTREAEKKIVWCCLTRLELGKKSCNAPTIVEETLHQTIVNSLNNHIDKPLFTEALMAAAELVLSPGAVQAQLRQLLDDMNSQRGTYPNAYTRAYAASLLESQDAEQIDAVTGATHSGGNFEKMASLLIEKAKAGDASLGIVQVEES